MDEYIEREAAIAVIEEKQKELCPVGMYSRHAVYGSDREKFDAWQEIIETLERIPAADVRPVVVCTDCEHNNHCLTQEFVDDCGKIPLDRNTFFCADGERRSNA